MHILCLRVLVHYECVTGISILRGQQLAQGCIMNMIYTLHLSEVFAANFSLLFFFFGSRLRSGIAVMWWTY